MKNLANTFFYYIVLVLSAMAIFVPILSIGLFTYDIMNNRPPHYVSCLIGLFLVGFNKPLTELRIKLRNQIEYDEFGMSKKKGSYERLSKKEKDKIDFEKMVDMERVLNSSVLSKMTKEGSKDPWNDMNRLIGLQNAKKQMKEMVARMEFEKENKVKKNISARHMVFTGSPGTGKTTVARIITGFLYQNKYIKKNKCIEVDGNFLKAGTPGDTALKTELIIRQAYDGVLFIDEAYALIDSGDGCGNEAVATLIKQMEDNRDRFILILAGYTNEMKRLLQINPGFKSRIKEYIDFPDYSDEELKDIFMMMAMENNMCIDGNALDAFYERIKKEKQLKSFGNARTVRNILDESIDRHALNYKEGIISKEEKFKICYQDINTNIKQNIL